MAEQPGADFSDDDEEVAPAAGALDERVEAGSAPPSETVGETDEQEEGPSPSTGTVTGEDDAQADASSENEEGLPETEAAVGSDAEPPAAEEPASKPSRVRGKVPIGTVAVGPEPKESSAPPRGRRGVVVLAVLVLCLVGGVAGAAWSIGPAGLERWLGAFTAVPEESAEPPPTDEESVESAAVPNETPEPDPTVTPTPDPSPTVVAKVKPRRTPKPKPKRTPVKKKVSLQDLEFLAAKADVLYAEGKLPAAKQQFQKVINLDPGYAPAHFGMARTLERMGDAKGACREWRRYLSLAPAGKGSMHAARKASACK